MDSNVQPVSTSGRRALPAGGSLETSRGQGPDWRHPQIRQRRRGTLRGMEQLGPDGAERRLTTVVRICRLLPLRSHRDLAAHLMVRRGLCLRAWKILSPPAQPPQARAPRATRHRKHQRRGASTSARLATAASTATEWTTGKLITFASARSSSCWP